MQPQSLPEALRLIHGLQSDLSYQKNENQILRLELQGAKIKRQVMALKLEQYRERFNRNNNIGLVDIEPAERYSDRSALRVTVPSSTSSGHNPGEVQS